MYTGLVPTEITTLGVKFAEADQRSLLRILALVIAYFLAAFIIYAASDFLAWWRLFLQLWGENKLESMRQQQEELEESIKREEADLERRLIDQGTLTQAQSGSKSPRSSELELRVKELRQRQVEMEKYFKTPTRKFAFMISGTSLLRVTFEFALPIVLGLYTIVILVL